MGVACTEVRLYMADTANKIELTFILYGMFAIQGRLYIHGYIPTVNEKLTK
jgi:hypothetical protein